MSKPTILILSIVYLASVLIVGIFGMQVMSFNNINYIDTITIDVNEIEFSNGQVFDGKNTIFKAETITDDGIPYEQYTIFFKYSENLNISIKPKVVAKDPTLDPTDGTLNVSSNNDNIIYNEGVFTVKGKDVVTFVFNSQDSSNKKMVVKLWPR